MSKIMNLTLISLTLFLVSTPFAFALDTMFQGHWGAEGKNWSFSLVLIQKGNKLTGQYCAMADNGNRIDCGSDDKDNVSGIIRGNVAKVKFISNYEMGSKKDQIGKAKITLKDGRLYWLVTKPTPNGYYYCPDKAILTRVDKNGIKDRASVLCPNKQCAVFIRKSSQPIDYAAENPDGYSKDKLLADQIWIVDLISKKERILVTEKVSDDLTKQISHIDDDSLKFSPDGKMLYFITDAWVTSGAVHAVNLDGSNEHFIDASASIDIIPKGKYKGDLILNQHRYFLTGGSYDWYYVFTPDGHEVGTLGDDLKKVDWNILYEK